MKIVKKLVFIIGIGVLIHFSLLFSGNIHLYNTLENTVFKGRLGPSIDEYGIFSNRKVIQGKHEDWLVSNSINSDEISDESASEFVDLGTVAYLVIHNDSIVKEQYWDGYSENSQSNSFSMAKSILNIAIGSLIRDGKITSIDDPVSLYLPEFDVSKFPELSIRHLLQMSSGINFDENYINPFAYPAKANYGDDLVKLTYSYSITEQPGKQFKYRSGNSQLLSFIIAKASGMETSEYVTEKIWKRIGAKNEALWSLDKPGGKEKGFCCFNSNARDFARIGKLFLQQGVWNNDTIVDAKFVAESITPAPIMDVNDKPCTRYGLHWWLHQYEGYEVFYARGILGQYIAVIPALDLIVVRLGHKRIKPKGVETPPDFDLYLKEAISLINKR
jgi:CubicO group peptidase (beta-lactamase class C family)